MTEIRIKTPRGIMRINADEFFPNTRTNINKLLKIIMDPYTGEGEENLQEIIEYMDHRISSLKAQYKYYEDLHNAKCTDTDDFFDLMYLKKHSDLIIQVTNAIKRTVIRMEKNLEFMKR